MAIAHIQAAVHAKPAGAAPTTTVERRRESRLALDRSFDIADVSRDFEGRVYGVSDALREVTTTTEISTTTAPGKATLSPVLGRALGQRWGVHDAKKLFALSGAERDAALRKMGLSPSPGKAGTDYIGSFTAGSAPETRCLQRVTWDGRELRVATSLATLSRFEADGERLWDERREEIVVSKSGACTTTVQTRTTGVEVGPPDRTVYASEIEALLREKGYSLPWDEGNSW